jgi:hypothetical protein
MISNQHALMAKEKQLARTVLHAFCTTRKTTLHLTEEDAAHQNALTAILYRMTKPISVSER